VLAETGRVTTACNYAQLTKQSAYALRARDPLFAASWDAACELARAPLADALYERALDGVTETISKDGQVIAERHRYDSRLSVSVLNRLDRRCDRALETGAHHLAILRRWDEWLALVGKGEEVSASALLDHANLSQFGQLPEGENPTGSGDDEPAETDHSHRCWKDEDDVWMTDFPPPEGFDRYQSCDWGDPVAIYVRECTDEEVAILEADAAAQAAGERAEEEEARDAWFSLLRAECSEADSEKPDESEESSGKD